MVEKEFAISSFLILKKGTYSLWYIYLKFSQAEDNVKAVLIRL